MKISHFEKLRPICPRCWGQEKIQVPLRLQQIEKANQSTVIEGLIVCGNCENEYPIIHSVPIIVPNIRDYIKNNLLQITFNDNFSPLIRSVLSDATGSNSELNQTQHYLSVYGWDHYADKAPKNEFPEEKILTTCNISSCLDAGLQLFNNNPSSPMLEMGCALGRGTFELAEKYAGLTLGIDTNFWKLRLAQTILNERKITFPLKQYGTAYVQHSYEIEFEQHHHVDFWVCNALALPFPQNSFHFISALNIIDMVPNPKQLLLAIRHQLSQNGKALISTPYDWSSTNNNPNWLGGQHQHRENAADSEHILRNLIEQKMAQETEQGGIGNLALQGEIKNHPWNLRIHKRHVASYDVHILAIIVTQRN